MGWAGVAIVAKVWARAKPGYTQYEGWIVASGKDREGIEASAVNRLEKLYGHREWYVTRVELLG